MKSQRGIGFFTLIFLLAFIAGLVMLGMYLVKLDDVIRDKFEGQRWDIPAKVYARPLELKLNQPLIMDDLLAELQMLNYKKGDVKVSGSYLVKGSEILIHTRGFHFGESVEPEQIIAINIQNGQITSLKSNKKNLNGKIFLEPVLIGGIYPQHNEDRVLLKLDKTPKTLINALIATEDRNFYKHHGISLRGTARAIVSNVTGGKRQGGSTLTQQLVKNFYLTSEKTYKRKVNEALMAMLLELHYSKDEILETYLNEVNLGQDGSVSINGYGLASQFYFGRPLNELNIAQHAFLAGLVQGPTLYNPKKNPQGALKRRNIVLKNMLTMGYIDQKQYDTEIKRPLGTLKNSSVSTTRFPDFMDLVRRQLRQDYLVANLENQGLNIYTTLDPVAQNKVERTFKQKVKSLSPHLQGATIVADPRTGFIQVAVGSSENVVGFNRALDAKRQVGSLLKPVIFLNALESERYNWASLVQDTSIELPFSNKTWAPKNYGGREHGEVPMVTALAQSYNLATVRIANENSLNYFIDKLHRLGIPNSRKIPNYPSIWLGAVELTPMDILTMYQTFANGGQKRPLQSIYRVVDQQGKVLERFVPSAQQIIKPDYAYLLNYGLQQVVNTGTGQAIKSSLPNLAIAGKTGTTNDGRDAWFAGYSGNHVAVVWVGLDNNKTTGLTGSTGALPVWINVMKQFRHTAVDLPASGNIVWQWIDKETGYLSAENCGASLHIPMTLRSVPTQTVECAKVKPSTSLDELSDEMRTTIDSEIDVPLEPIRNKDESDDDFASPIGNQTSFNEQNMPSY